MQLIATFQLSHFQAHNKGLRCREKCGMCNKAWSKTNTQQVHMMETLIAKNGKTVGVLSYICDSCEQKTQSKT